MMNKNDAALHITTLLAEKPLKCQEGELCVPVSPAEATRLADALQKIGYTANDEDSFENGIYYVGLSPDSWSGETFFYINLDEFWRSFYSCDVNNISEYFYIINGKISSHDAVEHDSLSFFKSVLMAKSMLKLAADFDKTTAGGNGFSYFVTADNDVRRFEITADFTCRDFEGGNFDVNLVDTSAIEELLAILRKPDNHETERREVLRAALAEIYAKPGSVCDIKNFMVNAANILRRFNERYELYVNKFSVNRLISEIDAKNLDFISKVNDFVSDSQGKVLVVPGALIATASLVKDSGFWVVVFVFFGMLMVSRFISSANEIHRDSLAVLREQVNRSLHIYNDITDDAEVKQRAASAAKQVNDLIDKFVGRLKSIDCSVNLMCFLGVLFAIARLIFNEQFK